MTKPNEADTFFLKKKATYDSLVIARFARFFNPKVINIINPTRADFDEISFVYPDINIEVVNGIFQELPRYKAKAKDLKFMEDDVNKQADECFRFWTSNAKELPKSFACYQMVVLFCPTSAAAERLISVFSNIVTDKKSCFLEDSLEAAVILPFNNRK